LILNNKNKRIYRMLTTNYTTICISLFSWTSVVHQYGGKSEQNTIDTRTYTHTHTHSYIDKYIYIYVYIHTFMYRSFRRRRRWRLLCFTVHRYKTRWIYVILFFTGLEIGVCVLCVLLAIRETANDRMRSVRFLL